MPSKMKNPLRSGLGALIVSAAATGSARATEGYFVEGNGARGQALAGSGSANPQDAFTTANNPAGLVDVGHQLSGDLSIFNPNRQYNARARRWSRPAMSTAAATFSSSRRSPMPFL